LPRLLKEELPVSEISPGRSHREEAVWVSVERGDEFRTRVYALNKTIFHI
jgi:hypothetical protein